MDEKYLRRFEARCEITSFMTYIDCSYLHQHLHINKPFRALFSRKKMFKRNTPAWTSAQSV